MSSLSNSQRIGYGVGDIAICFYWSGVGLYLLYFYTDIVGISPYLAGWIYALGIAWDAVTDPFMGYLADRTSSKRGKNCNSKKSKEENCLFSQAYQESSEVRIVLQDIL